MAKSIFQKRARARLIDRLGRLRPDSPREWGRMNPAEMICHLHDVLLTSTGQQPIARVRSRLRHPVLRWMAIYGPIPWPKAKVKTVPEMQRTRPADFEADRRRLIEAIEESGERGPGAYWAEHPAFGQLSGRDFGVLLHRHIDYHFRQFGV